jgi:hypothetical protein
MRQIIFLPLGILDSYVSLIQNKIFFCTLRRISDLTNLAVTSWNISCLLSHGLYGRLSYGSTATVISTDMGKKKENLIPKYFYWN